MREKGLSQELTSLERLVKYAERRETSWGRFASRDGRAEPWRPSDSSPNAPKPRPSGNATRSDLPKAPSSRRATPTGSQTTNPQSRRSHTRTSRNCPKRQTARAPHVHTGTVRIDGLDDLARERDRIDGIHVNSLRVPLRELNNEPNPDNRWFQVDPRYAIPEVEAWCLAAVDPHEPRLVGYPGRCNAPVIL